MTQVQVINLIGNRLTQLPDSFCCLTELQSLTLVENRLQALPESFGRLASLRFCQLQRNPDLRTLPASFAQLKGLQQLSFDEPMRDLPEEVSALLATVRRPPHA